MKKIEKAWWVATVIKVMAGLLLRSLASKAPERSNFALD